MTDVLKLLPIPSFGGIEFPITSRNARFRQGKAIHDFVFKDGQFVEGLGVKNWVFSYTIPFREDIIKGPYEHLFTQTFPAFTVLCRDKTPRELVDPVYGVFRCECLTFDDESDPRRRDGDDVRVEFIHSPLPGEEDLSPGAGLRSLGAAETQAGALDEEVGAIFRSNQKPPAEPIADLFGAIEGVGAQLELAASQVDGRIAGVADRVERIETQIAVFENPRHASTLLQLRRLRAGVNDLNERLVNPAGTIQRITTTQAKSIGALAASVGTTNDELMKLNPELAQHIPLIPAGIEIKFVPIEQ